MTIKIAFAGDRDIAVRILDFIHADGVRPVALLTSDLATASHAHELTSRCSYLAADRVFHGREAFSDAAIETLRSERIDFLIGIHFPLIIPGRMLELPRIGTLNLHPAYLPWNRGWHTPTWAILDGTPAGATLHFMDAGLDTGDIVHQRQLEVSPADTAHSLYARLLDLEVEVFKEAWPALKSGTFTRTPQITEGTAHRKSDLAASGVQQIDLDTPIAPRELLKRLRALTTNHIDEAAYFESDGRRWRVQVRIEAD